MTQTPPPTGPPPGPRPLSQPDERTWAIMAHIGPLLIGIVTAGSLGFVAPLIIWLALRDRSAFVADQAKEALNFQITLLIGQVVGWLTVWLLVGWLVLAAVWVIGIVFAIIAAVTVNRYEAYRYPVNLRVVR
ncbi:MULTISPECIES: DUF4870 domain-containing protein [Isoptericola]|uniref:DUF4870 domain-containing protein n=1 Tax=Isoptericola sediminis TaxID=2733572 RepID=A0A849K4X1_9MICO|nr:MULTISPECIES: DUF4870 domain-containing protein [Isoptericola]MDO8145353.1 DUF4870 domain-containing protein [Isoptericola sp. 178]MDO8148994.1 DUF4870 domain-containing protein [Isoptericola sp. b515]NNU28398.1 DUF4870 domain-containing protein [Isoptericola sediminis]